MAQTLPTKLRLEIVTPERQVVRDLVSAVSMHGKKGYLGILPGHAPLLTELVPGETAYTQEGKTHYLAVSWGFAEVLSDRVILLAQTAERAEEIDVERAERAKTRAEQLLKKLDDPNIDVDRAQAALSRSLARLQVAGRVQE